MASAKTITINGRTYDAVTGMLLDTPVEAPAPATKAAEVKKEPRTHTAAGSVHTQAQRSKTLHRRAAKKPAPTAKQQASAAARPAAGRRHMDIARSTSISKFAPHPETKSTPATKSAPAATAKPASKPVSAPTTAAAPKASAAQPKKAVSAKPLAKTAAVHTPDRAASTHPAAQRALAKTQAKKQQAAPALTAKQKKEAAISKAMAAPEHKKPATKKTKKSLAKKMSARHKKYLIIAIVIAVFVIGAAVAYKVFPSISVGIAASRAGISATYPEYTPDGFALSQPVTFKDGEVALTFKSNSSDRAYTITQQRSSWDSSSVLDNIVQPAAGNNYVTTKERGLTIFTYGNNASWINGGLLYTISGDTQLSGDQVRRIATSL